MMTNRSDLDKPLNPGNLPSVFESDITKGLQGLANVVKQNEEKANAKHRSKKFFGFNLDVRDDIKMEELRVLTSPSFASSISLSAKPTSKVYGVRVYIPELFGCYPLFTRSELKTYQELKSDQQKLDKATAATTQAFEKVQKRLSRFPVFYIVDPTPTPTPFGHCEVELHDMSTMYYGRFITERVPNK
jgi:hypothetical protein